MTTHTAETVDGKIIGEAKVASGDWAWAKCSADNPFPGTPDPTQICVKGGFNPKLLYQVVFTSNDAYVLGIGFAAFRDVASFFKYAAKDDEGTANPLAPGVVDINRANRRPQLPSPLIALGFTQDESSRQVYDGAWPIIAESALANVRSGSRWRAETVRVGREGAQWWGDYPIRHAAFRPGHPRSLYGQQDLPEGPRALRIRRSVALILARRSSHQR